MCIVPKDSQKATVRFRCSSKDKSRLKTTRQCAAASQRAEMFKKKEKKIPPEWRKSRYYPCPTSRTRNLARPMLTTTFADGAFLNVWSRTLPAKNCCKRLAYPSTRPYSIVWARGTSRKTPAKRPRPASWGNKYLATFLPFSGVVSSLVKTISMALVGEAVTCKPHRDVSGKRSTSTSTSSASPIPAAGAVPPSSTLAQGVT